MTEPTQAPDPEGQGPASAEPPPAEPAAEPTPAEPAEPAPTEPAADPTPSGWVQPGAADPAAEPTPSGWVKPTNQGGGMSRGCCLILAIVGGIVAILVVVALAFTFFLGSQIQSMLAGTVEFEAGDVVGCYVQQPENTFPASTTIHFAAHFEREVPAGETVTSVVTYPDGTSETNDATYAEAGDCISDIIPSGLDAGPWTIEFRAGTEVLATGGFEITE